MTGSKSAKRCGHYEQVKVGVKWMCTACGQTLTVPESIQNFIELSDVMREAIESRIPLNESLDLLLGRKEWNQMLRKIPKAKPAKQRGRKGSKP